MSVHIEVKRTIKLIIFTSVVSGPCYKKIKGLEVLEIAIICLKEGDCDNLDCCLRGHVYVDLYDEGGFSKGDLPGINVDDISEPIDGYNCSRDALVIVDFDGNTTDRLPKKPYCGRQMLKIEMELSDTDRIGYMFNIGDSDLNDGGGGDQRDSHDNDAEVEGKFPGVRIYPNNKNSSRRDPLLRSPRSLDFDESTYVISISNIYVSIEGSLAIYSEDLFILKEPNEKGSGVRNGKRIYVAFNRVVHYRRDRLGVGLCSATLKWTCD